MTQASCAPLAIASSGCGLISCKTLDQSKARMLPVTVARINPAFTIWIRSSLLRFLSAKSFERGDRFVFGSGDDDLANIPPNWCRERDTPLTLRSDGYQGGDDISHASIESRLNLIGAH